MGFMAALRGEMSNGDVGGFLGEEDADLRFLEVDLLFCSFFAGVLRVGLSKALLPFAFDFDLVSAVKRSLSASEASPSTLAEKSDSSEAVEGEAALVGLVRF